MQKSNGKFIHIVGGGLAGSEAAWQLARVGIAVKLHEMRPNTTTAAHHTASLAELVCSNSFRSDDATTSAVGLLHEEMRQLDSLIIRSADAHRVPAGSALAVDRDSFSTEITKTLENHPLITIDRFEVTGLPPEDWSSVIIATGPLTSPSLADAISELTNENALAFFDAIAPIVYKESINFDVAWFQSRYDKGDGKDYINCPMTEQNYFSFIQALKDGQKTKFHPWEEDTPYFEGCLPIEVMAERGPQTLSYGPMKPVGLTNPNNQNLKPHAIVQLRQDNALGTLYNMVGFQTKLTHGEQVRIFRTIPGLENAEFARLGGIHRNTFINSRRLLTQSLCLKAQPRLRFAGQITGCEGYVESAAIGLLAGLFTHADIAKMPFRPPPATTALGALLNHITKGADPESYQPMNINFGLFPPVNRNYENGKHLNKRDRKLAYAARAREDLNTWLRNHELTKCQNPKQGSL